MVMPFFRPTTSKQAWRFNTLVLLHPQRRCAREVYRGADRRELTVPKSGRRYKNRRSPTADNRCELFMPTWANAMPKDARRAHPSCSPKRCRRPDPSSRVSRADIHLQITSPRAGLPVEPCRSSTASTTPRPVPLRSQAPRPKLSLAKTSDPTPAHIDACVNHVHPPRDTELSRRRNIGEEKNNLNPEPARKMSGHGPHHPWRRPCIIRRNPASPSRAPSPSTSPCPPPPWSSNVECPITDYDIAPSRHEVQYTLS